MIIWPLKPTVSWATVHLAHISSCGQSFPGPISRTSAWWEAQGLCSAQAATLWHAERVLMCSWPLVCWKTKIFHSCDKNAYTGHWEQMISKDRNTIWYKTYPEHNCMLIKHACFWRRCEATVSLTISYFIPFQFKLYNIPTCFNNMKV